MRSSRSRDAWRLALALGAIAFVTLVYARWLPASNAATVSTTFLLVVLVVAAASSLQIAIATSVAAMLALNFFFLPPVGTFTIADPQNWMALFAFLAVSLVASHLSAVARARTEEAVSRRDELARLFDLGRDVMVMTEGPGTMDILARSIARRFDLEFVAIALPHGDQWRVFEAGARTIPMDLPQLSATFAAAQASLEFDAYSRTYAGHRTMTVEDQEVRLVPLRAGARPIGVLAAAGRPIELGTLDALAGVVAIAIERAPGVDRARPAHATHRDPAGRQQPAGLLADGRGPSRADRPDPGRGRTAVPALPERSRDGAHRRRRRRRRGEVDAPLGDSRRRARPGRPLARGAHRARGRRHRRAREARPPADRDGDGPPAGERRAVHACRIGHQRRRPFDQ